MYTTRPVSPTKNCSFSGNKQYNLKSFKLIYITDSKPKLMIYFKLLLMLTYNNILAKLFAKQSLIIPKNDPVPEYYQRILKIICCDTSFYHFSLFTELVLYTSVVPPPIFGLGRLSRGRVL